MLFNGGPLDVRSCVRMTLASGAGRAVEAGLHAHAGTPRGHEQGVVVLAAHLRAAQRKGTVLYSAHTTPHTALHLNKSGEALRQRNLAHLSCAPPDRETGSGVWAWATFVETLEGKFHAVCAVRV